MTSASTAHPDVISTKIPTRLDRLPWARFHWRIVFGLGTAWILDGLEVTLVGAIAAQLTMAGSGLPITAAQIGEAAAIYVLGACLGAVFFGQLTDRHGRKKLFMITLGIYIVATAATAFSVVPWYFFLCRFVTGAGIGGEYAAINSAIDELIPARARGRIDLGINGSYWLGAVGGSLVALFFLSSIFPMNIGWRLAFGLGVVLGLTVLVVRRNVPESPRWLFIHGQEDEAERIVDAIEREVEQETHEQLEPVDKTIEVRQRAAIPFRSIARTGFKVYPRRAVLVVLLFVGQAFIYNAITFNLGTLLSTFFGVAAGLVPIFIIVFAAGNFLGPVTLGRLFDTVGRKPMISGTYLGSAAMAVVLALLFREPGLLGPWTFILIVVATFFLASSGASAAYLTASEIFPLETRALAIAFFYAIGTAVGGIAGPLLFGNLINSGSRGLVAWGFIIGAIVMAIGGVAELVFGVKAEGEQLEDIAAPLSAEEADEETEPTKGRPARETSGKTSAAVAAGGQARPLPDAPRRRFQPGPRTRAGAPGYPMLPSASSSLAREIASIERALEDHGATDRPELARIVGARFWGPGVFHEALRLAVATGEVRHVGRARYALASDTSAMPSERR